MGKFPSVVIATILVGAPMAAFFWLTSQPVADPPPLTDRLTATQFGCIHQATLERVAQLQDEGDQAAAVALDQQNFGSGECAEFRKGTIVTVEEMHALDGIDKVHAQGNPDSYWIPSSVLQPVDASSATQLGAGIAAASASSPNAGSDSIGMQMLGCKSLKTFKRVMMLFKNDEEDAHATEIQGYLASGECVMFEQGTPVQSVESIDTTYMQVRPAGGAATYWTFWSTVDQH